MFTKIALNQCLRQERLKITWLAGDKRENIRKIKVNPGLRAPSKLTSELYKETSKKVHLDTVRRALKESVYNGRIARKIFFVNRELEEYI